MASTYLKRFKHALVANNLNNQSQDPEIREAFALFDKRGAGAIPRESLGDLLRALGQNPTQAEVADLASQTPRDSQSHISNAFVRPVDAEDGLFFNVIPYS